MGQKEWLLPPSFTVRPNFDGNSRIAKCFFFGARSGARPTNELTDADGVLRRIASLFTPIASLVAPHADRAGQIQSATKRIALGCENFAQTICERPIAKTSLRGLEDQIGHSTDCRERD